MIKMKKDFVDIWYGDIVFDDPNQQTFWHFLSNDEQKKANTFKREDLQKKYIYTRASLRKLLASYIDNQPQDLDIKTGRYGKPYLSEENLYFNLSHTGNRLVIAISNLSNTGIDLEQYKNRKKLSGLVDKCFSKEESAYWYSLPAEKQAEVFYQFWVKKEAFVKAVGKGISMGLHRCAINPENQTRFLSIPADYGLVGNWKIVNINLDKSYACALVVKTQTFKLKQALISH